MMIDYSYCNRHSSSGPAGRAQKEGKAMLAVTAVIASGIGLGWLLSKAERRQVIAHG
jgi:hypothetical protein